MPKASRCELLNWTLSMIGSSEPIRMQPSCPWTLKLNIRLRNSTWGMELPPKLTQMVLDAIEPNLSVGRPPRPMTRAEVDNVQAVLNNHDAPILGIGMPMGISSCAATNAADWKAVSLAVT